jgi:hypothetical protein
MDKRHADRCEQLDAALRQLTEDVNHLQHHTPYPFQGNMVVMEESDPLTHDMKRRILPAHP